MQCAVLLLLLIPPVLGFQPLSRITPLLPLKSFNTEERGAPSQSQIYDEPWEITCDPDFPCDDDGIWSLDREVVLMLLVPGIAPFLAFFFYNDILDLYHMAEEVLSGNNWVAVDGRELQAKLLTPTINGLVVPAVALLFATMTSTTISTLRQRQIDVRRCINIEAGELRAVECLVDAIEPGFVRDQCRAYLIQYTSRLLGESDPGLGAGNDVINPRRGFDSELNGFTRHLNKAHGGVIPAHVADECYASVARLREQRANRITALQSIYPTLHYVILFVLALAECVAFLMETAEDVNLFLNGFEIKILFSMMVGTFVACFAVFWDLRNPFSGSYQISATVDQLHTIKMALQASRKLDEQRQERKSASSSSEPNHGKGQQDADALVSPKNVRYFDDGRTGKRLRLQRNGQSVHNTSP